MRTPLTRLFYILATIAIISVLWIPLGTRPVHFAASQTEHQRAELRLKGEQLVLYPAGVSWWVCKVSICGIWDTGRQVYSDATVPQSKHKVRTINLSKPPKLHKTPDLKHWYSRPAALRWRQYNSDAWEQVRVINDVLMTLIGIVIVLVLAAFTGTKPQRVPWILVRQSYRTVRFVAFNVFRPRLEPGDTHGTADWADWRERLAKRLRRRKPQLVIGKTRVLCFPFFVSIPLAMQFYHSLIVAPPGSGKTSGFIIPAILRETLSRFTNWGRKPPPRRSFIATDPKGELIRKTSRAVRKTHHVLVLDFMHPERSSKFNPIPHIHSTIQADLFAHTWVVNTGLGRDEFWAQMSEGMISNAAYHLARLTKETGREYGLPDMAKILYKGTPQQILEFFKKSPFEEVNAGAANLEANMGDNEKMRGAGFQDLQNRMRRLIHEPVAKTTSQNEIDFEKFGREPTALYIRFDMQYTDLLAPITAVFFAQLFDVLMNEATENLSGTLDVPLMLYLDEFGNIGQIPEVWKKMAQLRSYGVSFNIVLQNLAQLEDVYGGEAEAKAIIGSCWTKMILSGASLDDTKEFSELAGNVTVLTSLQGDSRAITERVTAGQGSRQVSETGRPLIMPDEIRRMRGKVLAIVGDSQPMLLHARRYYLDPMLRWMVPGQFPRPQKGDPLLDFTRAPAKPQTQLESPELKELPERTQTAQATEYPTSYEQETQVIEEHQPAPRPRPQISQLRPLNNTERDILLTAESKHLSDAKEIAEELGRPSSTIRARLTELRTKFNLDKSCSLAEIVRAARENHLLNESQGEV